MDVQVSHFNAKFFNYYQLLLFFLSISGIIKSHKQWSHERVLWYIMLVETEYSNLHLVSTWLSKFNIQIRQPFYNIYGLFLMIL